MCCRKLPNINEVNCVSDCESNRSVDEVGEKRKQVKQKLLEEVLRQKHELEKKQAERQKVIVSKFSLNLAHTGLSSACLVLSFRTHV